MSTTATKPGVDPGSAQRTRLSGGAIHPLWLNFAESGLEARYQLHREQQASLQAKPWILTCLVVFAAFGLVEYLLFGADAVTALLVRYTVVLPLVLAMLYRSMSGGRQRLRTNARLLSLVIIQFSNLLLYILTPFPANDVYLLLAGLALIYTEGLSQISVRRTAAVSVFVVLAFVIVLLMTPDASLIDSGLRTLALLALLGLSLGNHYNQELAMRRDFRRRLQLEAQSRHASELVETATMANSAKSRFLAMMSHELRTPLNAIIGFSEIIKTEMFGKIGDRRYCEYAADIDQSGRHLLAIINDLLDLSKAEAEHLQLMEQHIDVQEAAEAALAMVRSTEAGADKHFIVEIAPDLPHLWADGQRLQQMLLNLLSNACKFTDVGGDIRLYGHLVNGGLEMGVKDSGIGIHEDDVERVLSPFVQVDSLYSRRYEGTGLGLPLVKALIELHGGRLQIGSHVGSGTDVRLVFPPLRTKPDLADELSLAALKRSRDDDDAVGSPPGGPDPWQPGRTDASSA